MSVLITLATAGLGTLFSSGKLAPKYLHKAFEVTATGIAEGTAKVTGKSLVRKVIAKQVLKCVSEEAFESALDAGISLCIEKVLDQLSQSMDNISEHIIHSFDDLSEDKKLKEAMRCFLQQEDPEMAESHALKEQTFLEALDYLESRVDQGVKVVTQAHKQAIDHLKMCNEKLIRGQRLMKGVG